MTNERVSAIRVKEVAPGVACLFMLAGPGKIVPRPGVIVRKIGDSRFSVVRMLDGGGKAVSILEIVGGILRAAAN